MYFPFELCSTEMPLVGCSGSSAYLRCSCSFPFPLRSLVATSAQTGLLFRCYQEKMLAQKCCSPRSSLRSDRAHVDDDRSLRNRPSSPPSKTAYPDEPTHNRRPAALTDCRSRRRHRRITCRLGRHGRWAQIRTPPTVQERLAPSLPLPPPNNHHQQKARRLSTMAQNSN